MEPPVDLVATMETLARERPVFHSEADFQHALAWELRRRHPSAGIRLEFKPLPEERVYMDIWLQWSSGVVAIELKYATRALEVDVHGERFSLRSQAAQDITRYDFVKDIARLEAVVRRNPAAVGYALLLTNDSSYWKRSHRLTTVDQAFRLHEDRRLEGSLAWEGHAGSGTTRGRETAFQLDGAYDIHWRDYSRPTSSTYGTFRYTLVEIGSRQLG